MKKTFILITAFFAFASYVNAQSFTNSLNTTGNVGIGTSSPTNALTFSSTSATGVAIYNTSDQNTNYERLVAQFASNVFTLGNYFGGTGQARSIQIGVQQTAGVTTLAAGRVFTINPYISAPAGDFDFDAANSGSGSVITMNAYINASSGQQNVLALQNTVAQTGATGFTELLIAPYENSVGTGSHLLIDAGTNNAASNGGTHTPLFTLDDHGNSYNAGTLAIGTTYIPSGFQASINGNLIATGVTVQVKTSWPDYVFEKNYRLPKLNYLKNFIGANQHLPGMPSAAQVKADGIDLGEMNKLLTQKVEELTLYLIDKDTQLKSDESKIKADEDKLKAQEQRLNKLESELQSLLKKAN